MSGEAQDWMWRQRGLADGEFRVGMRLASYHNKAKGMAWPKASTLAAETEKALGTVRRILRSLEEKGLIVRHASHHESGRRTHNYYTLNLTCDKEAGEVVNIEQVAGNDQVDDSEQVAAGSQGRWSDMSRGGGQERPPLMNRIEPKPEPKPEPKQKHAPDGAGSEVIDFESYRASWNEMAAGTAMPTVRSLSDGRKAKLRTRLKDPAFDWQEILREAKNATGWAQKNFLTFPWVIVNGENHVKLTDGNYRNGNHRQDPEPEAQPTSPKEMEVWRQRVWDAYEKLPAVNPRNRAVLPPIGTVAGDWRALGTAIGDHGPLPDDFRMTDYEPQTRPGGSA